MSLLVFYIWVLLPSLKELGNIPFSTFWKVLKGFLGRFDPHYVLILQKLKKYEMYVVSFFLKYLSSM